MFRKILVPLDGSPLAEAVLPYIKDLALNGRHVILLQVAPPIRTVIQEDGRILYVDEQLEIERAQAQEYLENVAGRLRLLGLEVETAVRFGEPAKEIVDYASGEGIDLVAMSTHGRTGLARLLYGSVAGFVLRHATVPVMMIRAAEVPALAHPVH